MWDEPAYTWGKPWAKPSHGHPRQASGLSRAVPGCNRRQAFTAQPHPLGNPLATGCGRVLTTTSHPWLRDVRLSLSPVRRWAAAPADRRNRLSETRAADGSRSKRLGGTAARTEVLLGESANRRGAPVSQPRPVPTPAGTAAISGASAVFRRLLSTQCSTATSHSRPPPPHRDGTEERAPEAPRSRHRAGATPGPPRPTIGRPAKLARTRTARSSCPSGENGIHDHRRGVVHGNASRVIPW